MCVCGYGCVCVCVCVMWECCIVCVCVGMGVCVCVLCVCVVCVCCVCVVCVLCVCVHGYKPCKDICTKDTSNDIPEVGDIVHIGKGTGYQNVTLSLDGKSVDQKQKIN